MSQEEAFLECVSATITKLYPSDHPVARAFNKYTEKRTLRKDSVALHSIYGKSMFLDGEWLTSNSVVIGTRDCGIYISLIYYKTYSRSLLSAYVDYLRSIGLGVNSASTRSSHSSSEETSSETSSEEETAMGMLRDIYSRIKPELGTVVDSLCVPPPDGVHLSAKTRSVKEADIQAVKSGIQTFETLSGYRNGT